MHLFESPSSPSAVSKPAKEKYLIWSIYPELSSSFPVIGVSKTALHPTWRREQQNNVVTIRVSGSIGTRRYEPVSWGHIYSNIRLRNHVAWSTIQSHRRHGCRRYTPDLCLWSGSTRRLPSLPHYQAQSCPGTDHLKHLQLWVGRWQRFQSWNSCHQWYRALWHNFGQHVLKHQTHKDLTPWQY